MRGWGFPSARGGGAVCDQGRASAGLGKGALQGIRSLSPCCVCMEVGGTRPRGTYSVPSRQSELRKGDCGSPLVGSKERWGDQ